MHHPTNLIAAGVAVLAALPTAHAGLYTKSSPVIQVDGKNYERLIAKSNYTSIVEFYAPWCGHCQSLQPAYEKAARNLDGLAKVAAMDCDEDANKPFCGGMGIKGFPTLKIVRPGKKGGKPVVEDYQGARTATGIVEAVVSKINNHVAKVTDKDIDSFLDNKNETAKAILFTDKGTTSALLRSLAIDFLDVVAVGQVRNKEKKTVDLFGISNFPTLILLPGGDKDAVVYDGELKKGPMVTFLSQAGSPNPDPAPPAGKKEKKEKKAEKSKTSTSTKASTPSPESAPTEEASAEPIAEQQTAPVVVNSAPPIPSLNSPDKLQKECLSSKSTTCVLAFVPATQNDVAEKALTTLAELSFKHAQGKRHLFPFYAVPSENAGAASVVESLQLAGEVEIVALNAKRGWWRHYEGDFAMESVESWIDAIRLSEGIKKKLPAGLVVEPEAIQEESVPVPEEPVSESAAEPEIQPPVEEQTAAPTEHEEL